jgi:predicted alpha-1,6-mannanase (GH76 family)
VSSCGDNSVNEKKDNSGESGDKIDFAERNMLRAMEIADSTMTYHLVGSKMSIAEFYNPFLDVRTTNIGGVWMYSSVIEGVNSILNGLQAHKKYGNVELYNKHYERYLQLLRKLYDNLDYYKGKYTVTSFTQTKEWNVYAVHRGNSKGTADTNGNVYDDQQWLIIELLKSYKITGDKAYLDEAEYLTEYVLDGWDCTLDENGSEHGGIPWGPGYVTKHACSNGPVISPLVWLYELYKDKEEMITYRYIATDRSRKTATMKKSDYYLKFAKNVYNWQKSMLLRSDGVYDDMQGGCDAYDCKVSYEYINGVKYRKYLPLGGTAGPAITYNSGTMLSGAADLYRVTDNNTYLSDAQKLSDASFNYFAKLVSNKPGCYTYDLSGYRNWFNGILMRGYVDVYPYYNSVDKYIDSFQKNLDYGYKNYLHKGFLPHDLLLGWKSNPDENSNAAMFSFAFAAEYANLARYELEK